MLSKLSNTEAFQKEYNNFKKQIDSIKDSSFKDTLNNDLKKLFEFANEIDIGHSSEFNGMINPSMLSDTRTNLNNIRLNIKNKLKQIKLQ
jgi:hypothetical protein